MATDISQSSKISIKDVNTDKTEMVYVGRYEILTQTSPLCTDTKESQRVSPSTTSETVYTVHINKNYSQQKELMNKMLLQMWDKVLPLLPSIVVMVMLTFKLMAQPTTLKHGALVERMYWSCLFYGECCLGKVEISYPFRGTD